MWLHFSLAGPSEPHPAPGRGLWELKARQALVVDVLKQIGEMLGALLTQVEALLAILALFPLHHVDVTPRWPPSQFAQDRGAIWDAGPSVLKSGKSQANGDKRVTLHEQGAPSAPSR